MNDQSSPFVPQNGLSDVDLRRQLDALRRCSHAMQKEIEALHGELCLRLSKVPIGPNTPDGWDVDFTSN